LLRKLAITRPNQVWCSDITYIPVRNGFLYLVAIMDWATRKVLSWRLSNTLDASFCVEALEGAIVKYGKPEIMNTDQGSQYTGSDWIKTLTKAEIKISMDGRGRYLDNIFIERLWRSLKQEAVYLHEITDCFQAKRIIDDGVGFYNAERPHTALDKRTPDAAYFSQMETRKAASTQNRCILATPQNCPKMQDHFKATVYAQICFLFRLKIKSSQLSI
jgi:putative transposase